MDRLGVRLRQIDALAKGVSRGAVFRRAADDAYREQYRELLARAVAGPANSDASRRARLQRLASTRAPLPGQLGSLRVVGFGTDDDWRRNGIWAALRRRADFHLFVVPDGKYREQGTPLEEMRAKEVDFLRFIDELGGVQVAILSHSGRHVSDGLLAGLRQRGIWSIIMSADDQHQFIWGRGDDGEPHQLRVARQVDLYWSAWRLGARVVDGIGGTGWYAPHAADPDRYHPIPCEKDVDIAFVGGRNAVRQEVVSTLERYFRVAAFGYGWPGGSLPFDESLRVFSRAKIVLGVGGIGHSFAVQMIKGRDFEVAMCGATYLTSAYSEVMDCFDVGREIACYVSPEDAVEVAAHLLVNDDLRTAMGHAARARCLRDHTWEARLESLFALFGLS